MKWDDVNATVDTCGHQCFSGAGLQAGHECFATCVVAIMNRARVK